MNIKSYLSVVALMAAASFTACQDDYETVENRVLDSDAKTPATVLIDGMTNEQTVSFTVKLVEPVEEDVDVTYAPDFSMLEAYNAIYQAEAIALPAENYNLVQPVAKFENKSTTSTPVEVEILNINDLDRDIVYVLPLTVKSTPIPVIESQKTRYIVVRGAALINVACNMVKNNGSLVNPGQASGLNGLTQMTFQCVFNVEEWGGKDSNIQSLAGIEGSWLLRISDSGVPANQLQFVTPSGNLTDASWQFTEKKWVCMSFTWDAANSAATLFIDGVKKNTVTGRNTSGVSWGNGNFYIGKSYNDNRWLNGAICEVRVWNRILSDAEIAEPLQAYSVPVDSEGLVSYWKFNEGDGQLIQDYANGYNLQLAAKPKWIEVTLPE